jgi:hypothetical protein
MYHSKELNFALAARYHCGWSRFPGRIIYRTSTKRHANLETEMMMRMKWMQAVVTLVGIAALSGVAAQAQTSTAGQSQTNTASQTRASAATESQFDIGISGFEAFTSATNGDGTRETPKNGAGGMLEARYINRPLIGFELTYSFNIANESFAPQPGTCGLACANPVTNLSAKMNEVGLDYVVSKKFGSLRPFAVGGLGILITAPAPSNYIGTPGVNTGYGDRTVFRPGYVFGGGADWAFLSHFGIRVQFRDNVYRAPNLSLIYPATGKYTYSAEPMGGVFYNF